MKPQSTKTPQAIRDEWVRKGISQNSWARQHGFSIGTVSQVLNGKNSGRIGVGHRVSVALGIKAGELVND